MPDPLPGPVDGSTDTTLADRRGDARRSLLRAAGVNLAAPVLVGLGDASRLSLVQWLVLLGVATAQVGIVVLAWRRFGRARAVGELARVNRWCLFGYTVLWVPLVAALVAPALRLLMLSPR